MEKQKERLVELLDNAKVEVIECYPDGTPCMSYTRKAVERKVIYKLADHLLANGVVVPPCKAGDKLYYLYNNNVFDLVVEKIVKKEAGLFLVDKQFNDWYSVDEIGKTLYLTKEEAEKKLKRGDKNA